MKMSERVSRVLEDLAAQLAPGSVPGSVKHELKTIAFELWEEESAAQLAAETIHERMPSALEVQEGGSHYKGRRIQPIEYMHANGLDYARGAVVKYVTRDRTKNKEEDIKKAIHFCQFILEMDYNIRSMPMQYER